MEVDLVDLVHLVEVVEVDLLEAVVALGSLAPLVPCCLVLLREPPLRSVWASYTIGEYKEAPPAQR